ncbi:hypothetical protein [Burkholderia pseudomallei]|nr:hypothetical protein [Burkholderia pseudomallei]
MRAVRTNGDIAARRFEQAKPETDDATLTVGADTPRAHRAAGGGGQGAA